MITRSLVIVFLALGVDDAAIIERIHDDASAVWQAAKPQLTPQQLETIEDVVRPSSAEQSTIDDLVTTFRDLGHDDVDPLIAELLVREATVTDNDVIGYMRNNAAQSVNFLRNVIDADEYEAITVAWRTEKLIKARGTMAALSYDLTAIDIVIADNTSMMEGAP